MSKLIDKAPYLISLSATGLLLVWAYGCESRTKSLIEPTKQVTRPELVGEIDYLMAKYKIAISELDKKDEFRNIVLQQSIKIANSSSINPLGVGTAAIVDLDDYENLKKYKWYIIKQHGLPYAARKVSTNGKVYWVRMHRQIMHTPTGYIVHHKNRRTLDNRKINLINLTDGQHTAIHNDPFMAYG